MSEKRKRQTQVLCTDQVWSEFQGLAAECDKTLPQLLGEIVENQVGLRPAGQQSTLTEVVEENQVGLRPARQGMLTEVVEEKAARVPRALPPRTLIGFGHPVVRVR
jgi:hypothetical protein